MTQRAQGKYKLEVPGKCIFMVRYIYAVISYFIIAIFQDM